MPPRKPPSRLVSNTFGKGSAARQQAKKEAHLQPFRDAYARNEGRAPAAVHDDDADFAAAVRRGLGLDADAVCPVCGAFPFGCVRGCTGPGPMFGAPA